MKLGAAGTRMPVSKQLLNNETLLAHHKALQITFQRDQLFSSIQLLHTHFIQPLLEPQSKVPKSQFDWILIPEQPQYSQPHDISLRDK